MIVYLDLLLVVNFVFDYLILLTFSKIFKQKVKKIKLILGSLIGELSLIVLFIDMNGIILFCVKLLFCFLIIFITFGPKRILENMVYYFLINILLGGFIYYLKIKFNIPTLFLFMICPVILYFYTYQCKRIRNYFSNIYAVDIYFENGSVMQLKGYLDTGNMLKDPYKNRPVVIVNSKRVLKNLTNEKWYYIPFNGIEKTGIIKCFKPKRIYIEKVGLKNDVLIAITETKFQNNIDCIFGSLISEGR